MAEPLALEDLSGIQRARDAGYSDDEITKHLAETRPNYKTAIDHGYGLKDIEKRLYEKSVSYIQGIQALTLGPSSIVGAGRAVMADAEQKAAQAKAEEHTGPSTRASLRAEIDADPSFVSRFRAEDARERAEYHARVAAQTEQEKADVQQMQGNRTLLELPRPEGKDVVSGVVRGLEKTAEGLTSPGNLVLAGALGGAPAALQKVASVAFAAMMAKGAYGQAREAFAAGKTSGERAEAGTEALASTIMATLAATHAAGGFKDSKAYTDEVREHLKTVPDAAIDAAFKDPKMREGLPYKADLIAEEYLRREAEKTKALAPATAAQLTQEPKVEIIRKAGESTDEKDPLPTGEDRGTGSDADAKGPVRTKSAGAFDAAPREQQGGGSRGQEPPAGELLTETEPKGGETDEKAIQQAGDEKAGSETSGPKEGQVSPTAEGSTPAADLTPAIRTPQEVLTGKDHAEIIDREGLDPDIKDSEDAGFVDKEGNFLSREEAAKRTGLPTATEPGKLHSEDLPNAELYKQQAKESLKDAAKESKPDTDTISNYADRLPEDPSKVIRSALIDGKTAKEAGAEVGWSEKKAQDVIDRATKYLGEKKTPTPGIGKSDYTDEPTSETRKDSPDLEQRLSDEAGGIGLVGSKSSSNPFWEPAVKQWVKRVQTIFDIGGSVKRFVESAKQRDMIAATFDAVDNAAGYVAKQAGKHVELASDLGEHDTGRAKDIEMKAATFVAQAKGDLAGMLVKLEALRQNIKGPGMLTKPTAYATRELSEIIEAIKTRPDELQRIADAALEKTDEAWNQAQGAGIPVDYFEGYVKGAYDFKNPIVFDEKSGKGSSEAFKKSKVFNDYAEAMAAGFKPKELRLDKLTESAVLGTMKAVNRRKWADSLDQFTMPDGKPSVAPMKPNGTVPRDYRPVQVMPGKVVNVHQDIAPTVKALTAESAVPKLLSEGAAFLKHNILVFDIFHGSRFAQMYGAFTRSLPSYSKGLTLLDYADADLARGVQKGLISQEDAAWASINRPKMEALQKSGLNAGKISDALYSDVVTMLPGAKTTNSFIFDKLSRGFITQAAVFARDRNQKLYPNMSEAELNRYTAKEVNTYFRNLGSQGVFKSKTWQDAARLLLFAPQWIEGMARSEARGYGQAAKSITGFGKPGNIAAGMGTGLVAYAALAQVVNLMTRGKPTWENEEPGHKFDAWIPDPMQGSKGLFVSPLSVFAENTHDVAKYLERGKEPLDVASQLAQNKLHPAVRAFWDLAAGRDFFGRPLHGWERVEAAAADAAPIPLAVKGAGQYKGAAERQILSTLGIKAVPAPSDVSNVYSMADEFKRKNNLKPSEFRESDYRKLRESIQEGSKDQFKAELEKLKKTKSSATIDRYFSTLPLRSFTGSAATDRKFKSSLDRGQLDLYNSALREREEIAKQYRQLKNP